MRLTVLGSSAAYPLPGNPASGFLVETEDARIWLDAGTGTFAALQALARREGRHWADLDAVVVSHTHGDHCLDLVPLYYALRFLDDGVAGRERPALWWPPGSRPALDAAVREDGSDKLGKVFVLGDATPGSTASLRDTRLRFAATDHSVPAVAVRIESAGRTLVYTGDTGPGTDLADFARGADLLLAEATYQEEHVGPPVHLRATEAGELARRADAGRLVLTHVWPTLDPERSRREARETAGDRPVELALPGRRFSV